LYLPPLLHRCMTSSWCNLCLRYSNVNVTYVGAIFVPIAVPLTWRSQKSQKCYFVELFVDSLIENLVAECLRHRSYTTMFLTNRQHRFEFCSYHAECVRKFVSLLAEGRWSLLKTLDNAWFLSSTNTNWPPSYN
jgi:hypothetical protein